MLFGVEYKERIKFSPKSFISNGHQRFTSNVWQAALQTSHCFDGGDAVEVEESLGKRIAQEFGVHEGTSS